MSDEDQITPRESGKTAPRGSAKPTWSSGAKTGVGTSATGQSQVWYTVGHGTINEIYYPDVDKANTRSVRFLVADGVDFFSDEETDTEHRVEMLEPGVPGYRVTSTDKRGRYRLSKEIIADPDRSTLLMRVRFEPMDEHKALHLYLFVEPHIDNKGDGNEAWVGHYLGVPMLFAKRNSVALAVACERPFLQRTCGHVGKSDALTDLREHFRLANLYTGAPPGKVALCGEVDWNMPGDGFLVAIGFGEAPDEAALLARASVSRPFQEALALFTEQWRESQAEQRSFPSYTEQEQYVYRASTAVLSAHELRMFPGGMVASLSIPWGFAKADDEVIGYHVLWPRDMVQSALGKLASGDAAGARRTLFYLTCTQRRDGSWSQNMWKAGKPHWDNVQMDTIALPILLANKLRSEDALKGHEPWEMVCSAAEYLLKFGPVTEQERWEKLAGFSVSSMAAQIAALLAAADFADEEKKDAEAGLLRETADSWNTLLDDLLYVRHSQLAQEHGVAGYYMRIAPCEAMEIVSQNDLKLKLSDLEGNQEFAAVDVVSPDAWTLVRYGLRSPNDPRMAGTAKVIDATVGFQMKTGRGWTRSSFDGYGEKADGSPYDKTGIGRCWPLLAGERGHYALAAGDKTLAREMLATMARQTSECGMIPEQVWNAEDIPERELINGRANGSSMPLAWAHAEYIRLLRSLDEGSVWDMPSQTTERYAQNRMVSSLEIWTEHCQRKWITAGRRLRIDLNEAADVAWRVGGGVRHTTRTLDARMQRHCVYLDTKPAQAGSTVEIKIRKSSGEVLHLQLQVIAGQVHTQE